MGFSFAAVSELLLHRTGIYFAPGRYDHLANSFRAAMQDLQITDEIRYTSALQKSDLTAPVWQQLLHHLALGETYFFRNVTILRERLLPDLITRRRKDGTRRLTVWTAGCATGEEPYTIAMLLCELIPDMDKWQVSVIGTDVNLSALDYARRGRYNDWSLRGKAVPEKFLRREGQRWQVIDAVRNMVEFRYFNVIDESADYPTCDLIICRNLVLYMVADKRQELITRLKMALVPDGEILLSETGALELTTMDWPQLQEIAAASSPDEILRRARQAIEKNEFQEAHLQLDRAESMNRLYAPIHYLRALAFEGEGNVNSAIQALTRCLYLNADFVLAYYRLSDILLRYGDLERARIGWSKASKLLDTLNNNEVFRNGLFNEVWAGNISPVDVQRSINVQMALHGED
jgi:chemotaxis methyl-accepting protein methylase